MSTATIEVPVTIDMTEFEDDESRVCEVIVIRHRQQSIMGFSVRIADDHCNRPATGRVRVRCTECPSDLTLLCCDRCRRVLRYCRRCLGSSVVVTDI